MPGRIAPLSMAWRRRMGSLASPFSASGEASDGNPVMVELLISGVWTDITSYVMTRDGSEKISITRGRRDEGSQVEHSTCNFQLNNRDGRFSPRNPTSPYYGVLGRNQQMRVSVPGPNGSKLYRFWGEISSWPTRWDLTGTDIWVEAEAAGLMRRLNQGAAATRSVIYNAITDPQLTGLIAYWPCEDAATADRIESDMVNGSPMLLEGAPDLAAFDRFGASDPLPDFTGFSAVGGVTKYDTTSVTSLQVRFLMYIPPEGGLGDLEEIVRITVDDTTYATRYWDICYNHPADTPSYGTRGTLKVDAKDGDEAALGLGGTTFGTMDTRGRFLRVSLELSNNGANLAGTLRTLNLLTGETDSAAFTEASTNVARVLNVQIAPDTLLSSAGASHVVVGHVTVQTTITDLTDLGEAVDPSGEAAGRRVQRLCNEAGIPFEGIGDLDSTALMGGQSRSKPVELMREAELADAGMLFETLSVFGMGYRTRESMLNQAPAITLSYPANQLSEVPEPVDDDQNTRNKVTASLEGGASKTAELDTGSMGTSDPPTGIGVYGEDVTLNLKDATTLEDQAYWRLQLGTVDEARFPQISVNLARSQFVDNPALKWQALGVRTGDRLLLQDPPEWLPPDDISQLVLGLSETIDRFEHKITWFCAPESPWRTGVLEDEVFSRIDTDGSAVYAAATSVATTLYVAPTGIGGLWTTDDADFPFDVRVAGEVMTVTDITHTGSDDFTRSVSNDWGTSSGGDTWTVSGTATDFSVNGTQGVVTLAASPTSVRVMTLIEELADVEVLVTMSVSQVATGASIVPTVLLRFQNASDFYRGRLHFGVSGGLFTSITRGTTQVGSTTTLPWTYSANDQFYVRVNVTGNRIRVRAWPIAEPEPIAWHSDETIGAGNIPTGDVGLTASAFSGNTNVSPQLIFDDFQILNPQKFTVTRSVNGVVKAQTAGADLRLAYPTILSM